MLTVRAENEASFLSSPPCSSQCDGPLDHAAAAAALHVFSVKVIRCRGRPPDGTVEHDPDL